MCKYKTKRTIQMIFGEYDLMYFLSKILPVQSIVSLAQIDHQTQEIVKKLIMEKYANATRYVLNRFTSCRLQTINDNVVYEKTILLLLQSQNRTSGKYKSLIHEYFTSHI
jgi:hypothetical protein